MDLKSRPGVSPLLENEMARVCGWLKTTAKPSKPVYRRPYRRMLSRRPYAVTGKVAMVAREAAWGGVSYPLLMEGMPMYNNATLCNGA